MERRTINPWNWQDQFGFVQAEEVVGAERVLYCAGQAAMSADGVPQHQGDMRGQLALALANLETVLTTSGYDVTNIVRLSIYTTDVDGLLEHFALVAERLRGVRFASTLVGVTRLAIPDLLVEIEATAVR